MRDALLGPHDAVGSLYVHVPFCFHKCHYCDFYSFVDTQDRQGAFTDRLCEELAVLAGVAAGGARPSLRTIFVGGGTPSLLKPNLWERVLATLIERFDFERAPAGPEAGHAFEFTVECNPETVTAELMRTLRAGGVTRVSVGAQSFQPGHLKTLERWHDPANVERAMALAADAGIARRSLDLIYAVPGQTLEDWRADLERALAITPAVEHLSAYALTYEPNTAMTARLARGDFARADEDLEVEMYDLLVARLRDAGLERYEVSNFAAAGAECRHNLAYWRQESWLAAGPSASGHVRCADPTAGGWRWKNVPRLTDWMDGVLRHAGWAPAQDVEPPEPRRALIERAMTGLRLREGIDEATLLREAERFGAAEHVGAALASERDAGLLRDPGADGRARLSDRGFHFADGVARRVMRAIGG